MEDFYEHIDDFKNGLLEGELLAQFEGAMESDESLKLAVKNYDSAKKISEGLLEIDMMATLSSIENGELTIENDSTEDHSPENIDSLPSETDRTSNSDVKTKTSIFNIRNLMAAASVISVIFFAGWWMMESNAEMERKEYVFEQIDKRDLKPVDPDATKSIGIPDSERSLFENGKHYYSLNKFEESSKWFEQMIKEESDDELKSLGYYWLGHAYIQMWRVEDAKKAWEKSNEEKAKEMLKLIL